MSFLMVREISMSGKCPSCKNFVVFLYGSGTEVRFEGGDTFRAVTYNCPSCGTILGCQIDPIALRTDIVNLTTEAVLKALGK
jgi:predicted RNA-binding Zn-ribbon protein involved in translation (DUF1610 family)